MPRGGTPAGRLGFSGVAVSALLVIAVPAASANTYFANKTGDHAVGGCTKSDCTLREAVVTANVVTGTDRVLLRGRETYRLSIPGDEDDGLTGDLDVTDPTKFKVRGPGKATVDANEIDRVFSIFDETKISELVIRDGQAGGGGGIGVFAGELLLTRSKVSGNDASQGGGLGVGAPTTIKNSTISGNDATASLLGEGGGILASAEITIVNSTVSGNDATYTGGGLTGGPDITIKGSTFSRNTSGDEGGAIRMNESPMVITNSTFSGNRADGEGGALWLEGGMTANAVTIVRNRADADNTGGGSGGGIYDPVSPYLLSNSILALNEVGLTGSGPNCGGLAVPSAGYNIHGNLNGCTWNSGPGDFGANPKVSPLANNGGPTQTAALKAGSPAIGRAGNSAPPRDQRGVKRKNPDIGAYERR